MRITRWTWGLSLCCLLLGTLALTAEASRENTVVDLIRDMQMFKGLDDGELLKVASICFDYQRKAPVHIIRKGAKINRITLIAQGNADLTVGDLPPFTISKGYMLGEMEFFDDRPAAADVQLTTDCRVVEINYTDLRTFIEQNPAIGNKLLTNMARELSIKLRATGKAAQLQQ